MIPPPADLHREIPDFVYEDDGWDGPLDGPYVPWQPDELLEELEVYDDDFDEYVPGYINNYAGDSSEDEEEEEDGDDWQNGCTDPNGVMPDLNAIFEEADKTVIDWDRVREEIYLLKEDGIDR